LVLSDGREISINLYEITQAEFRSMQDPKQKSTDEDALIARVSGMAAEEYAALPFPDAKRINREFVRLALSPIADPNSVSESTAES